MPLTRSDKVKLLIRAKQSPQMAIVEAVEILSNQMDKRMDDLAGQMQSGQFKKKPSKTETESLTEVFSKLTLLKGDPGEAGWTPSEDDIQKIVNIVYDQVIADLPPPEKGDKGDDPIPGLDFPDEKQIKALIIEEVKKLPPAEAGKTPVWGKDFGTKAQIKEIAVKVNNELSGAAIVVKVNALPITPDKQIDAIHIKNLPRFFKNALKNVKKLGGGAGGGGGGGGGDTLGVRNLTDQTDGEKKEFTLSGVNDVLAVFGTQWPRIFDPSGERADWTFTKATQLLTLTDEVRPPKAGQTLWALVIEG